MTLRLTRTSHGGPPALAVLEIDDDRTATLAQTAGNRIGRFARELTGRERAALDRAVAAAAAADAPAAPSGPTRPSGTVEQLVAQGLPDLVLNGGATPPAAFKSLLRALTRIRDDLADHPVAAIQLQVTAQPRSARLVHLGSEPIRLRITDLTVTSTLFAADSAVIDTRSDSVDGSTTDGAVGPDWTLPLTADLGIAEPAKGGFLTVTVGPLEADALGDGVLRPADLSWISE